MRSVVRASEQSSRSTSAGARRDPAMPERSTWRICSQVIPRRPNGVGDATTMPGRPAPVAIRSARSRTDSAGLSERARAPASSAIEMTPLVCPVSNRVIGRTQEREPAGAVCLGTSSPGSEEPVRTNRPAIPLGNRVSVKAA